MSTRQHLLIGLDGLGFEEIDKWLNDETFPCLASIASSGTTTELRSTIPPWTPCAWPSLLSGRDPGQHGVFDFFTREQNNYKKRLVHRIDVNAPYLFEIADTAGLTSITINYPVTHPVSRLAQGAIVPGYLAPEDVTFYPKWIRKAYEERYGDYKIYPDDDASDPVDPYTTVARSRQEMATLLDAEYNWDLLAVQFQVTDSVFHELDERVHIKEVLRYVDECVSDIIDLADDNVAIFIVSDHGMGDYEGSFYTNSWLAEQGYCETTTGDVQYFSQAKDALRDDKESNSLDRSLRKRVFTAGVELLSTIGVGPHRVYRLCSKVGLAPYIEHTIPSDLLLAAQNRTVAYERSEAFQLYFNSLGIHLNVEGRDPEGVVPPADYEEARQTLISDLRNVTTPIGDPVFQQVEPREAIYEGEHVTQAPDIICIPTDYKFDLSGTIAEPFRQHAHKNHKPEGIFLTNHDEVQQNGPFLIYDVAPTIAASLGIPIDSATDGSVRIPTDVDHPEKSWSEFVSPYDHAGTAGDSGTVTERLEQLGYME